MRRFLVFLLFIYPLSVNSQIVISVAVSVKDESGMRKKEGDIIAVRPFGWTWGTMERKLYLIVNLQLTDISTIQDARKLEVPHFDDGALWHKENDDEGKIAQQEVLAKRRYKISFLDMDNKAQGLGIAIDFNRVRDKKDSYQPVEGEIFLYSDLVFDRVLDKFLQPSDITNIKNAGK